jgi:gamma-glutamyltranspeptidase/glutathione hydrolase
VKINRKVVLVVLVLSLLLVIFSSIASARTWKPVLFGRDWVAITGKPLAATAGATIFIKGGNAADAACAMLAAACVMTDALHFGGETQALIYDPETNKVYGINGMGHMYTGGTPEFFLEQGMAFPPNYGVLAASTPGTPRGLFVMLAEFGTMSLGEILAPAIKMADGYPIEGALARSIAGREEMLAGWKYSAPIYLPGGSPPEEGQIFVQKDLANTFRKLVETEQEVLINGGSRKEAIMAANERFYKGDIAQEYVRASQESGGMHTMEDLAFYRPTIEEPIHTNYKGIEVYKLTSWTQGPTLIQMLNLLELVDMSQYEYNSAEYIHMLYQVMNLAFMDRDFYYGDPTVPPYTPLEGLLSKEYAAERFKQIDWEKNDPDVKPGDPYPFQGEENPYKDQLANWTPNVTGVAWNADVEERFYAGTTSVQAADPNGMVVSIVPSGGWNPTFIAGHTGVGMSQRLQQFVIDETLNPFNLAAPHKQPRVTLTPSLATKDGHPYLSFGVQGGDSQEQNLIQFFLNFVEFGFNVQEAAEAANFTSYQMQSSFGAHNQYPGRIRLDARVPVEVQDKLTEMGYKVEMYAADRVNSGPINAIYIDWEHQTYWGGSSVNGEDYGIGW